MTSPVVQVPQGTCLQSGQWRASRASPRCLNNSSCADAMQEPFEPATSPESPRGALALLHAKQVQQRGGHAAPQCCIPGVEQGQLQAVLRLCRHARPVDRHLQQMWTAAVDAFTGCHRHLHPVWTAASALETPGHGHLQQASATSHASQMPSAAHRAENLGRCAKLPTVLPLCRQAGSCTAINCKGTKFQGVKEVFPTLPHSPCLPDLQAVLLHLSTCRLTGPLMVADRPMRDPPSARQPLTGANHQA